MKTNAFLPLSLRLRESTSKAHSMAERTEFVRGFLRGVIDLENYRRLLTDYHYIYSAMESSMRQSSHSIVQGFYFQQLERLPALTRDLEYFAGADWATRLTPSPAAERYVFRIHEVSAFEQELLVAHAYTRYLGDLSCGHIFKKILVGALNLPSGAGTEFFEFTSISDRAAFSAHYRDTLDRLPLPTAQQDALIVEANLVFELKSAVFAELKGNAWRSLSSLIRNAFTAPLCTA